MTSKAYTCCFCKSPTDNFAEIHVPLYYRGVKKEIVPYCSLKCISHVLANPVGWVNEVLERAIAIVKQQRQESIDPSDEMSNKYRRRLLKEAARHAALI